MSRKTNAKLNQLSAPKILALLGKLASGDLDSALSGDVGLDRSDVASLKPDGETGALLDTLEKKAVFLLVRKARVSLLGALPTAIESLRGMAAAPASSWEAAQQMQEEDAMPDMDEPHPSRPPQLPGFTLADAPRMSIPDAKVMEQKRHAAALLFSLAKDLDVFELAKAYKEEDEERELARLAEQLGIGERDTTIPERESALQ